MAEEKRIIRRPGGARGQEPDPPPCRGGARSDNCIFRTLNTANCCPEGVRQHLHRIMNPTQDVFKADRRPGRRWSLDGLRQGGHHLFDLEHRQGGG